MEKTQARNRAWIGTGILGLFLFAAFFSCGCIDEMESIADEIEDVVDESHSTGFMDDLEDIYDKNELDDIEKDIREWTELLYKEY